MGDVFKGDERSPNQSTSAGRVQGAYGRTIGPITRRTGQAGSQLETMLQGLREQLAPREQELQAQLFEEYAPRYTATNEADVLRGVRGDGGQAVIEAEGLNRAFDPEYFSTRATTAQRLQELLGGGLTGGETTAIERGLLQSFGERGLGNVDARSKEFEAAATYGGAARDRLGQAIAMATQALPGFNRGTNTLNDVQGVQQGGGNIQSNRGLAGTNFGQGTEQAGQLGQQHLSGIAGQQVSGQNINANRRTASDHVNQAYSSAVSVCGWTTTEAFYGRVPWYVRVIRDHYYEQDYRIGLGYLRMCKVVVPLMRRSALFRDLILEVMIKPLTAYGGYITSTPGWEHGKHKAGVLKFWLKLWKFLGR